MSIHAIQEGNALTHKRQRVGRGFGSGRGAKTGRGQKGQKSRTGATIMKVFEGGQTPFIQKIPKAKGFKNHNRVEFQVVNLGDLEARFEDGAEVTPATLYEKGLLSKVKRLVKLLGFGTLSKKLQISVHAASATAKSAVEKAGGSVTLFPTKPVPEKKKK